MVSGVFELRLYLDYPRWYNIVLFTELEYSLGWSVQWKGDIFVIGVHYGKVNKRIKQNRA